MDRKTEKESGQDSVLDALRGQVIAVVVVDRADDGPFVAEALQRGGIRTIELALRTPVSLEALRRVRRELPGLVIGAGTVLTPDQAAEALDAGAHFAVAPGFNASVVAAARKISLPFAPGIATPSEIEGALQAGCRIMKYFPAESLGGLTHLRGMANPYQYLGPQFIPLGGVNLDNLGGYLSDEYVLAVGGSWLATREMISRRDWDTITAQAAQAHELAKACQPHSPN